MKLFNKAGSSDKRGGGGTAPSPGAAEPPPKRVPVAPPHDDDAGGGGTVSSAQQEQLGKIFDLVSSTNTLETRFKEFALTSRLPRFLLVGMQSAGKTTLIEALAGIPLGFSNADTGTRCPVQYHLKQDPHESARVGVTRRGGGEIVYEECNIKLVRAKVEAHMRALDNSPEKFSLDPLYVEIHSPFCRNLVVMDAPGWISNEVEAKRHDMKQVQKIVATLARDPAFSLILCIEWDHLASLSSWDTLAKIFTGDIPGCDRKIRPTWSTEANTIVVLNKADLVENRTTSASDFTSLVSKMESWANERIPEGRFFTLCLRPRGFPYALRERDVKNAQDKGDLEAHIEFDEERAFIAQIPETEWAWFNGTNAKPGNPDSLLVKRGISQSEVPQFWFTSFGVDNFVKCVWKTYERVALEGGKDVLKDLIRVRDQIIAQLGELEEANIKHEMQAASSTDAKDSSFVDRYLVLFCEAFVQCTGNKRVADLATNVVERHRSSSASHTVDHNNIPSLNALERDIFSELSDDLQYGKWRDWPGFNDLVMMEHEAEAAAGAGGQVGGGPGVDGGAAAPGTADGGKDAESSPSTANNTTESFHLELEAVHPNEIRFRVMGGTPPYQLVIDPGNGEPIQRKSIKNLRHRVFRHRTAELVGTVSFKAEDGNGVASNVLTQDLAKANGTSWIDTTLQNLAPEPSVIDDWRTLIGPELYNVYDDKRRGRDLVFRCISCYAYVLYRIPDLMDKDGLLLERHMYKLYADTLGRDTTLVVASLLREIVEGIGEGVECLARCVSAYFVKVCKRIIIYLRSMDWNKKNFDKVQKKLEDAVLRAAEQYVFNSTFDTFRMWYDSVLLPIARGYNEFTLGPLVGVMMNSDLRFFVSDERFLPRDDGTGSWYVPETLTPARPAPPPPPTSSSSPSSSAGVMTTKTMSTQHNNPNAAYARELQEWFIRMCATHEGAEEKKLSAFDLAFPSRFTLPTFDPDNPAMIKPLNFILKQVFTQLVAISIPVLRGRTESNCLAEFQKYSVVNEKIVKYLKGALDDIKRDFVAGVSSDEVNAKREREEKIQRLQDAKRAYNATIHKFESELSRVAAALAEARSRR